MRSCNPYFWHIGLRFYEKGMTDAIMEMARGFGLGTPTGIEFLEEEAGNIPFPQSEVDATNLAVGQGQMQVTPLQVAQFIAALGNGGTIYRPQIVESIRSSAGEEVQGFTPEEVGELPISAETAQALQEGMNRVVENPRGQLITASGVCRFLWWARRAQQNRGPGNLTLGLLVIPWRKMKTNRILQWL